LDDVLWKLSQDDMLAVQRLAILKSNAAVLQSTELSVRKRQMTFKTLPF
jgi:hypothetical protein